VKRAHELIVATGMTVQLHAYGTNVEGDLGEILRAIEAIHETLHAEGVVRLATTVKLGTRTDKEPTLAGKKL
jgi:uncharacterized protein (TIGR00106 family)